jgi:hypothetical protein
MSINIGGFGTKLRLIASVTFPTGIDISQFSHDADPLDIPAMIIAGAEMGANGDMANWNIANPLAANFSVFAKTDDDKNLAVLFEANRVAKGKKGANDIITLTALYPDGSTVTFDGGVLIQGMPADAIASGEAKTKSKTYNFMFENITRANATA